MFRVGRLAGQTQIFKKRVGKRVLGLNFPAPESGQLGEPIIENEDNGRNRYLLTTSRSLSLDECLCSYAGQWHIVEDEPEDKPVKEDSDDGWGFNLSDNDDQKKSQPKKRRTFKTGIPIQNQLKEDNQEDNDRTTIF